MKNIIKTAQIMLLSSSIFTTMQSFASESKNFNKEQIPVKSSRVQVFSIQNNTDSLKFQVFPPLKESVGLSLPMSTLSLIDKKEDKGIDLNETYPLIINCIKGSYLPVFIQNGDKTSGTAPEGYDGPYYISMWLPYPNVKESSKLHIPYVIKNNKTGKIGIEIGQKGDYRLRAIDNIKFIEND